MKNDSCINLLAIIFIVFIVILLCVSSKDDANSINAISTFFIALFTACAVFISYLLYELNKRQSILQMNQAFNTINQLILNNSELGELANKYAYSECKENDCETKLCSEKKELLRRSFLFSVLNIYEAYYIQNRHIFTEDNLNDTILKNLLTHQYVIDLIQNNNFDDTFKYFSKNYRQSWLSRKNNQSKTIT